MESPYHAPVQHGHGGFRLSLGFPLGTTSLLLLIFFLSGIFSYLYHWEKIRSLRRAAAAAGMNLEGGNRPTDMDQSLPVLMPGDHIPKFIALPCPCQPPPPPPTQPPP